ncbi:hypothetical protein LTS16_020247 [Friedmanniomyces endolithicus]|nr:hypothetical protein LTR57_020102 [Friedmanniomyces endolithicus]KAK0983003.1 hypothetical protein LTS01_011142 [Friedmanniomyces endolithicus]KAK1028867.1 hypothetical protein LTS16_020247 [Friedmanniomyces endolithicus]
MSRYNYPRANNATNANNTNYYDPVGSQPSQPTGYTYGSATSSASTYPSAATANYSSAPNSAAYQGYGSSYNSNQQTQQQQQQYSSNAPSNSGTGRAAAPLSSSTGQDYTQQSTNAATSSSYAYDSTTWGGSGYGAYGGATQIPNRTQSNNSPLHATQATSSTFGSLNLPDQSRNQSTTSYTAQNYQAPRQTSATSYTQPQTQTHIQAQATQQPQRYNSPLQAVQTQASQNRQAPRVTAHQPSPRMAAVQQSNRQQSGSVEPVPSAMTVNPSQVYDDRAERQRKAQIEAEKRRKREAEQAAQKAEEDRIAAEKAKARAEEDKQKEETEAAAKKAEYEHKAQQHKKAREEKRQSKSAAATLQKMASGGRLTMEEEGPPANPEEAEMRAMFKKMREFNAKNPAMLAKLWEEERSTHVESPKQPTKPTPAATAAAAAARLTAKQAQSAVSAASANKNGPLKSFQKPTQKTAAPIHAHASTSLWPPQKKGSLAEAATKWLANLPENAGKTIVKDDVLKILEANPSYVQLCEALEGLGLRFERSALARELLKAVPDSMKAQVHQQPVAASPTLPKSSGIASHVNGSADTPKKRGRPKKNAVLPASNTVDYEAPRFTSLADTAREIYHTPDMSMGGPVQAPADVMQPHATPAVHPPVMNGMNSMNGARALSASQPPVEIKPEVKPEEPRRPPADKEEAARKRTFGDLVDLTAVESDDEAPPKKMLFQMGSGHPNGLTQPNGHPHGQTLPSNAPSNTSMTKPVSANEFYKRSQFEPFPGAYPPLGRLQVARPWDPKPSPNSATMPSPNEAQPQPHFQPGKPKGPTLEMKQMERVKGKMLVEPIMRDRVARKSRYDPRTIARDVLLATGRHPDMRALNAHLNTMAKLLGDHGGSFEIDGQRGNRSDLSTIRWDIIDVAEPAQPKVKQVKTRPAAMLVDDIADADDEDDELALTQTVRQAVDNGDGTMAFVSLQQPDGKVKKKRRRKPLDTIASAETVSFAAGVDQPRRVTLGGAAGTPTQRGPAQGTTPASAPNSSGPVGYSQFRTLDAEGNLVKKKGRPFGWRKSVHSREAQGLEPQYPKGSGGPGGAGGPSRKAAAGEKALVEAKYQVWKCGWRGCKAELHNLDTLKKHVVKVHGKANGRREFECLWKGCEGGGQVGKGKGKQTAQGEEDDDDDDDVEVASFPDLARWLEHVNKSHLQPIAWKLGDGPRGGTSDYNNTDSEAYLSDAQGRSVTPRILAPGDLGHIHEAVEFSRVLPPALRRGHMTMGERKAAGELEDLEKHMKAVGVVMEGTGARFAGRKRRLGFLDDEEFEDEVSSEGVHWEGGEGEDEEEEADAT